MALLRQVPGVTFGPNSVTWQALIKAMEEAHQLVPLPGMEDTFLPMSCVTCAISELGTFLRPDDNDMVDVLTDLWDGQVGPWRRSIKTDKDTNIENPWVNIIGATTPAWMERNFPIYLIGGGLTSRCVFVYGDTKRQLVPYPADVIDQEMFDAAGARLVEDLMQMDTLVGEYELTKEAKVWGSDWYKDHWAKRPMHMASDRYDGYVARKQTHIHKLSMILAAAERNELFITKEDLEMANQIVTPLENDMAKVFQSIGLTDSSRNMGECVALIRAYKSISQMELWRQCSSTMSPQEFQEAITGAITAGYITQRVEGSSLVYRPLFEKTEKSA